MGFHWWIIHVEGCVCWVNRRRKLAGLTIGSLLARVPSVWRAVNMLMVPVRPSPATITWIPSATRLRSARATAQRHAIDVIETVGGSPPDSSGNSTPRHKNHHMRSMVHVPFSMSINVHLKLSTG